MAKKMKIRRSNDEEDDKMTEEEEAPTTSKKSKSNSSMRDAIKKAIAEEDAADAEPEDPDQLEGDELEAEMLRAGEPHTAADQRRVLRRHANPDHKQLLMSAKAKVQAHEAGEDSEPLSDDEMKAYLREQRRRLRNYGKVELTPKNLHAKKVSLMAKARFRAAEGSDMVRVAMFETIDPAPIVGHVKVTDLGYSKLEKGETYPLPSNVALVLAEGRKGAIVE